MNALARLQWAFIQLIAILITIAAWPEQPTGKAGLTFLISAIFLIGFWLVVIIENVRLPKIIGEKEND